jgi:Leucine-rich repeat (LRR) protein
LTLSNNKIKTLEYEREEDTGKERGWRHGLVHLQHLDLSHNHLSNLGYLPLALSGCKQLRALNLNNNHLYDVPLELGLLEQLTNIDLLGNSQKRIRMRVLTQSGAKVLEYMRGRMTDSQMDEARENHIEIAEAIKEEYQINIVSGNVQSETETETGQRTDTIPTRTSAPDDARQRPQTTTPLAKKNEDPPSAKKNEDKQGSEETIKLLKMEIDDLNKQMNSLNISQAKRLALKKTFAMTRSKLIREERKIKE